ncbi:MAG: ATP-binding protein [Pseudomonadota bacterium]
MSLDRSDITAQSRVLIEFSYRANDLDTRASLDRIMARLAAELPTQLTQDRAGIVEIALAEITNNIVEHAYAGVDDGEIHLSAHLSGTMLHFAFVDDGAPLPNETLPSGRPPDLNGPCEALPEGGFGWFLIHSLTSHLHYRRENDRNCLRVGFDFGDQPSAI